jgi:uncharacterized protein
VSATAGRRRSSAGSDPRRREAIAALPATWEGPLHGFDRAVLLTHGAGTGRDAAPLVAAAGALAAVGVPSLRLDFPYRARGAKAPDRAPVLAAAVRGAVRALVEATGLPAERLVLAGRSMGGRVCSLVAAGVTQDGAVDPEGPSPCLGLGLLGYPLHPAGKPAVVRDAQFPRLAVPVLFVSGTRDALAPRDELAARAAAIPGPVQHAWLDDGDHGFTPRKASGRTKGDLVAEAANVLATWVRALPA